VLSILDVSDDPTEWFSRVSDSDASQIRLLTKSLEEAVILRSNVRSNSEFFKKIQGESGRVKDLLESFIKRTPRTKKTVGYESDFKIGLLEGGIFFDEDSVVKILDLAKAKSEHRRGESVNTYWDGVLAGLAHAAKSVQVYDSYAFKLINQGGSFCLEKLLAVEGLEIAIHTDVNKIDDISDFRREAENLYQKWEDFLVQKLPASGASKKTSLYLYHPTRLDQHDRRLVFRFDNHKTLVSLDAGIEEFEAEPLPVPRKPNVWHTSELISEQCEAWSQVEVRRKFGTRTWHGVNLVSKSAKF
jgi:hypothetical protein